MLLRHFIPSNNDVEEIYIVKQEEDLHDSGDKSLSPETNFQLVKTDVFLDKSIEIKDQLNCVEPSIPKLLESVSHIEHGGEEDNVASSIHVSSFSSTTSVSEDQKDINHQNIETVCRQQNEKKLTKKNLSDLFSSRDNLNAIVTLVPNIAHSSNDTKHEPSGNITMREFGDQEVSTIPDPSCKCDCIEDESESSKDYKGFDEDKTLENQVPISCHGPRHSRNFCIDVMQIDCNPLNESVNLRNVAGPSKRDITYCYICRKDFHLRKKLLRHLRLNHTKDMPFNCTICVSDTITNLNRLNLHHVQHDVRLKRRCLYCPARFSCGQAVSRHMRKLHSIQYDMDAKKNRRFVCRHCSQKFTKKYDLEKHESKHLVEMLSDAECSKRELKCYICKDFMGKTRVDLNKHISLHSDWLPYRCGKCDDKLINSTRVLREHLRQHAEGLAIKCVYCEQRFVSLADCQRHEERTHEKEKQTDKLLEAKIQSEIHNTVIEVIDGHKRFKCDFCERSYTLLSTLRRHQNVHLLEESFECKYCSMRFNTSASLLMHEKRNHDSDNPFSCDMCGMRFKESSRLVSHHRTHSGEQSFICEICGKSFKIRQIWREHKLNCFGPEETQSCFCGLCAHTFENLSEALQHVKNTHEADIPDTKCRCCDLIFRDAESLVEHEFRHTLPGIITCKVCNRIFKHHKNLMRHLKLHADQPVPYMCDLCGKTFTQKGSLTIHRRIHTGERPFSCSLCHKGFVDKKEMRRHYTSHFNPQSKLYIQNAQSIATPPEAGPTGKKYKTYNCKICGRQFTSSSNLAKHVTTHTGEKKYMCEFCDKRFSQGGQLTVHRRIHTGERPFACDSCGERFLDGSSFKRHKTHKLCKSAITTVQVEHYPKFGTSVSNNASSTSLP